MARASGGGDTQVSAIVPLYNESATVEALLASLAEQSRLPAEVVLVDAGSTDDTAARASAFQAPFEISLVHAGRLNPGDARNEGVRHARHEWIAFIDGGIRADATWLEELMAQRCGVDVVFGAYDPVCDTFFRRCAALAYVPGRNERGVRGASVASMLLRRGAFDAVGGFPPFRAAEDLVFIERIRAEGLRVAYAPRAVVRWHTAPDVSSTFRRFALYSRVNLDAHRGRFWHRRLALQYLVVAVAVGAGVTADLGPWILAVVPAWLIARALKAACAKRRDLPFSALRPDHVLGTAALLFLIDLATWAGAVHWLSLRPRDSR